MSADTTSAPTGETLTTTTPAPTPVPRIEIKAAMDIDMSDFEMSVDMFDEQVDMSNLDSEVAAEVQSFATDVSSSFAASVSSALGVGTSTVEVTCLYRNSDAAKLDLLTLEDSCGSSRRLKALVLRKRRLQAQGFGVEVEVLGDDAVQSATSDAGDGSQSPTEMLAAQIASADVVIESDLLPAGVTVGAEMGEILVEVATQAPTPAPTADPTAAPTTAPTTAAPPETTDAPSTTVLPTTIASSNINVDVEEESRGSKFGILFFVFFTLLRS